MMTSSSNADASYIAEYDKIINWEKRLNRELPFLLEYLKKPYLLDLACSTGRHSIALAQHGYKTIGIDINPEFIQFAKTLAQQSNVDSQFLARDLSKPGLQLFLREQGIQDAFDSIILLGNGIAEMSSFEGIKTLFQNMIAVLKNHGRIIIQMVSRPETPHYVAIRKYNGFIHQRIMFPTPHLPQNTQLHVNTIDPSKPAYVKQVIHPKYMLNHKEFTELVNEFDLTILEGFSSYSKERMKQAPGESVIWVLEKSSTK